MGLFHRYKGPRKVASEIEAVKVTKDNIADITYYLAKNNHWYSVRRCYQGFNVDVDLKVQDVMRREINVLIGTWLVKDQEDGFYYVLENYYFLKHYSPMVDFEDSVVDENFGSAINGMIFAENGIYHINGFVKMKAGDTLTFVDSKNNTVTKVGDNENNSK